MKVLSILSKAIRLSLASLIVGSLAMATGALAQQTKRSPYLPKPAKIKPWQQNLDRTYRPPNTQRRLNKAKRSLYRDPGKALGLPSHARTRGPGGTNAAAVPLTLDPVVSHLDTDGDGAISRGEYFQGRSRLSNLGAKTGRNNQRRTRRLSSQFGRTDLNGDGKVTPDELQYRGNGRF